MRNTIISILMFASLLGFVFYANNKLVDLCNYVEQGSIEVEDLIKNEQWEDAYKYSLDIMEYISDKTLLTSIYINHCDFDNLSDEALELSIYVDSEDSTEALVAANSLKIFAENLKKLHETNIQNIF